jgi:hypothetical protein
MAIRSSFKDYERACKAPWWKVWGYGATQGSPSLTDPADAVIDYAGGNNFPTKSQTADQTGDVYLTRVDADNDTRFGEETYKPMGTTFPFPINAPSGTPTQAFFVVPAGFPQMLVTGISANFATANGAALTATITHESALSSTAGTLPAPGAGNVMHTGSFNLNATANVLQTLTLPTRWNNSSSNPLFTTLMVNPGDTLSIKFSTAITSLAGLVVEVTALPGAKGLFAVYNMQANGSLATQTFFQANRTYTVKSVTMLWSAAATNAGAVTLDCTIDTGTQAPGVGTTVLAAAQSVKGAANTPVTVALTATLANLNMAAGNRLAAKFTGTLTALAGVILVVWLQAGLNVAPETALSKRKEVTFTLNANASQATQPFWLADQSYEVVDASVIFATAAGGALTATITQDSPGTAPGGGTSVGSGTFNLNSTINTTQFLTPSTTLNNRILPKGGYLSFVLGAAKQSVAGITATVTLRPQA